MEGAAVAEVAPIPAVLSEIAGLLASGGGLDETAPAVLTAARSALGALACALWLDTPAGPMRAWDVAGDSEMPAPAEVAAFLRSIEVRVGGAGVGGELEKGGDAMPPAKTVSSARRSGDHAFVLAPLVWGGRVLGALCVRLTAELSPGDRLFLSTLADLLSPSIAHAEHSRQLEVEVRLRTRQIDEQRRFTERIIDSLPVGLYVIDREYRIHAWNRKRETGMQGVSREEALGRTIFEILHRQPAQLLRREFDDVFATGRIQQFQIDSDTTGDVRTYRISKIPMRVDDSDVTHVITIGEDITEWKEALERFAQSEKLAAIGQLAAGIMHEINNPLATIAACAESLALRLEDMTAAGAAVPPECSDYLAIMDNEVHRCKGIVDGLLDFSRPKPATMSSVDINAVIERTLFLLKHHSGFKKLGVRTQLDPATTDRVRGNPEQLVQVFMALLLNAMDAMGERGIILLRTFMLGGEQPMVAAEVIDHGHGIKRNDVARIFEPFYTTKPPGRGTGLGLSICYGIVADHGGSIEVESTPSAGSTFRILLPAGDGSGDGSVDGSGDVS
ncbi:MAG: ATP-binding protein [Gemmatimonadaceae bacterium]